MNGQPGAIFRDREGKVLDTWTLDVLDGRIQTIRSVVNPDKLGHVGPVADAWASVFAREVGSGLAGPGTDDQVGGFPLDDRLQVRELLASLARAEDCALDELADRGAAHVPDDGLIRLPLRIRCGPMRPTPMVQSWVFRWYERLSAGQRLATTACRKACW